jgi:hypothetical protein
MTTEHQPRTFPSAMWHAPVAFHWSTFRFVALIAALEKAKGGK